MKYCRYLRFFSIIVTISNALPRSEIDIGYPDLHFEDYIAGDAGLESSPYANKIYVANSKDNTVSVIYASNDTKKDIAVGKHPRHIAVNTITDMVYVANDYSSTVSAIDGSSDKVAAGVIFNVNPANSGKIICNNVNAPTNTYVYIDAGTNCTVQPNKDFEFSVWAESPLTNRNLSIPLDSNPPGSLRINGYGIFTANFKPPQQITTNDLVGWSTIITGVISAAVAINGALLVVPGWRRARTQRAHLEECMKMIDDDDGKSRRDAIEDKIIRYYVKGKLSEDHRQLLKDKISEYYGSVKGSESGQV